MQRANPALTPEPAAIPATERADRDGGEAGSPLRKVVAVLLGRQVAPGLAGEIPETWLPRVYAVTFAVWLIERAAVLHSQGPWPWINARVIGHSREMLLGDWARVFETPPLPSLVSLPFVTLGLSEGQAIGGLYFVSSIVQFGAFLLLARQLFPHSGRAQLLALALFLIFPIDHAIHHYRNIATVLASAGIFVVAAHWLRVTRDEHPLPLSTSLLWALGGAVLGGFSRQETLAFPGYLLVASLFLARGRRARVPVLYAVSLVVAAGALVLLGRVAASGPFQATPLQPGQATTFNPEAGAYPYVGQTYFVHTFLDSTPFSWLDPQCQANLTEGCRVANGERYFGPEDQPGGVATIIRNHPLLVVSKTVRSAYDNVVAVYGPNVSTYAGMLWIMLAVGLVYRPARENLRRVPVAAWLAVLAAVGVSLFPLSWGPPQPQFHLHSAFPVVAVSVPVMLALARLPWSALPLAAIWLANLALSAYRYLVYTGY